MRPMAPATPQVMAQMRCSGTPTDIAAWWSSETARSARPVRVREKNRLSASTSAAAIPAAAMSKTVTYMLALFEQPGPGFVGDADVERMHLGAPRQLREALGEEVEADGRHEQDD